MTEKEKRKTTGSNFNSTEAQTSSEQRRLSGIQRVTIVGLTTGVVAFIIYMVLLFQFGIWQILGAAMLVVLSAAIFVIAARIAHRGFLGRAAYVVLITVALLFSLTALFFSGAAPMLALGTLVVVVGYGILMLPRRQMIGAVIIGLLGAGLAFAIDQLAYLLPWGRFHVLQLDILQIFIPGIIGVVVLLLFRQLIVTYRGAVSIRVRLLIASVLMVALPAIAIGATSMIAGYLNGQRQVINHLGSVAVLKEAEVDTWLHSLQSDLATALAGQDAVNRVQALVDAPQYATTHRYEAHHKLQDRLQGYTVLGEQFEELFLLDRDGKVVLSTNPTQEGTAHIHRSYFKEGLKGTYVQSPYYVARLDKWMTPVSSPVKDQEGEVLGVLVGLANLEALSQIMGESAGLDETGGETYLVDSGNVLLTGSRFDKEASRVYSKGANTAIQQQRNGSDLYDNYLGKPVIGVYRWLPQLQMALLTEQRQAESFAPLYKTLGINLSVALFAVLLAAVIMFFFTNSITNPLTNLTQTAEQVAAGNLNLEARVERRDEVGDLALSFNSMTSQLRHLIANLEQRIVARTKRLEIAAVLSERLTAILDFDQLLLEMVNQVKSSFGYYHAHVYIIDEEGQDLVMTAGAGEAGVQMKAKGHLIPVNAPTSLVARAARSGQIVSVDNVREAPDWLPNPLLPDTFSEMAVPITVEGQALGVLDVQEDEVAGLDEVDADLLRSLASQVAIAIRNAQLFEQVGTELTEARVLQQQYVAQTWDRDRVLRRGVGRVQFSAGTTVSLDEDTISEARRRVVAQKELAVVPINGKEQGRQGDKPALSLPNGETRGQGEGEQEREGELDDGQSTIDNRKSKIKNALVAPITMHNIVIGDLQLHGFDPDKKWTENELALIEAVIDQVAQSAENMRLFEETQERASRERLIGEISDKMRHSPNMETLMKITVDELAKVLSAGRTFVRLGSDEQLKGMSE